QAFRVRGALGLVALIRGNPVFRPPVVVEVVDDLVGTAVADQVGGHVHVPVHGVHRSAVRRPYRRRDGEEGPEHQARGVEEHAVGHGFGQHLATTTRAGGGAGRLHSPV